MRDPETLVERLRDIAGNRPRELTGGLNDLLREAADRIQALSLPRSPEDGEGIVADLRELESQIGEPVLLKAADRIEQLEAALRHILDGSLSLPRFAEEQARAALSSPSRGTGR